MKFQAKKASYKPIALAVSLCALLIWAILGTGASLAWFYDVSPEIHNIFHVADLDLVVSHRLLDGTWELVDEQTEILDDEALYEPGYVQVACLKVENKGTVPFEMSTAVIVNDYDVAINTFGQQFLLQDHLKFGVFTADSEAAVDSCIGDRETAVEIADMVLHNYDTETAIVAPGETKYVLLVVRMPQEVGNIANYRGDAIPRVALGSTVRADQISSALS